VSHSGPHEVLTRLRRGAVPSNPPPDRVPRTRKMYRCGM
jgi:hypothetical protein